MSAISSSPDFVLMGDFGSPYGIKGWIKVNSSTAPPAAIIDYLPWYIDTGRGWQEVPIDQVNNHGKGVIAHITGFDDRDSVKIYTNRLIAVKREQLPALAKDEYYWTDLIGLTVINQHNTILGIVDHLLETGANDVLVITGEYACLIPFVHRTFIKEVDVKNKIIRVDWEAE